MARLPRTVSGGRTRGRCPFRPCPSLITPNKPWPVRCLLSWSMTTEARSALITRPAEGKAPPVPEDGGELVTATISSTASIAPVIGRTDRSEYVSYAPFSVRSRGQGTRTWAALRRSSVPMTNPAITTADAKPSRVFWIPIWLAIAPEATGGPRWRLSAGEFVPGSLNWKLRPHASHILG